MGIVLVAACLRERVLHYRQQEQKALFISGTRSLKGRDGCDEAPLFAIARPLAAYYSYRE